MAKEDLPFGQMESGKLIKIGASRGTSFLRQNRLVGSALFTIGLLTLTIGVLAFLIVFPLGDEDPTWFLMRLPMFILSIFSLIPEGTPLILLALPGLLIIGAGYALIRLGRRHFVTKFPSSAFNVRRDTILYLRPFIADNSTFNPITPDFLLFAYLFDLRFWAIAWLGFWGIYRHEELIEYAFRRIGRLITIGDPKDSLPQLGASRVYPALCDSTGSTEEDSWKTVVAEQITNARLILLHVGFSDSIHWEIEKVIAIADPQRVLLFVNPPKLKKGFRALSGLFHPGANLDGLFQSQVNDAWSQFRESFGEIFPHSLPESIGDTRFVKFDANWSAEPVTITKRKIAWFMPQRTSKLRRDTIDGVIAWLLWIMVPEPFARRTARKMINFATFIVAIPVFFIAILALSDLWSSTFQQLRTTSPVDTVLAHPQPGKSGKGSNVARNSGKKSSRQSSKRKKGVKKKNQ